MVENWLVLFVGGLSFEVDKEVRNELACMVHLKHKVEEGLALQVPVLSTLRKDFWADHFAGKQKARTFC